MGAQSNNNAGRGGYYTVCVNKYIPHTHTHTHIQTHSQHGTLIEGSKIQPREPIRTHSSPAPTHFLSLIFARLLVRALNAASCAICYIQQTVNIAISLSITCTNKHAAVVPPPPQPFYGPFSGTTRVSRYQENFWTLWCKGRLTEADTLIIQLGATPSGLTSAYLHHATVVMLW